MNAAKHTTGDAWTIDATDRPVAWRDVERTIVEFLQSLKICAVTSRNSLSTDARGTWHTVSWCEVELEGETTGELHVVALLSDDVDDDETDPEQYAICADGRGCRIPASAHAVTIDRTPRGTVLRIEYTWQAE